MDNSNKGCIADVLPIPWQKSAGDENQWYNSNGLLKEPGRNNVELFLERSIITMTMVDGVNMNEKKCPDCPDCPEGIKIWYLVYL